MSNDYKTKDNTVQTAIDAQNFYKYGNIFGAQEASDTTNSPITTSTQYGSQTGIGSWYNLTHPSYLKGVLLGAGLALLVTNPAVQKAVICGSVRLWTSIQNGVEEIKEQIYDVKAELSQED